MSADFSEARWLETPSGRVRIFRLEGDPAWRCVLRETSLDMIRDSRTGLATSTRAYASFEWLDVFCSEAKILSRPEDDDLTLIPMESITTFESHMLESAALIWSNSTSAHVVLQASPLVRPQSINEYLDTISLDFTGDLKLPCGNPVPQSIHNWTYALTKAQLSYEQTRFVEEISQVFTTPSGTSKPLAPRSIQNATDTLRKVWGMSMNFLKFTERQTRSLEILDPENLAFYFRFIANTNQGRDLSQSSIELERQSLKNLVGAMKTLAINGKLGLRLQDFPRGMGPDDVMNFLDRNIKQALRWVPLKGTRKRERLDLSYIPNNHVVMWGDRVKKEAKALMESWGPHTRKTEERAKHIQDLFVQGMLGPLYSTQRSEVLQTLSIGLTTPACTVPGCVMGTCKGNKVLTSDEYDQGVEEHECEYSYYIRVGHAKNYTCDRRGKYVSPFEHSPTDLGPTLQWLIHQMVTWSSGLLRELHAPNCEEKRLLINYSHGGAFSPGNANEQVQFSSYIKRIAHEVPIPPATFRFMFVRRMEITMSRECQTQEEANASRIEYARQMCSSLEEWMKTYKAPAPSLSQPGHLRARELAFGDA